jgi:hypothetical protein
MLKIKTEIKYLRKLVSILHHRWVDIELKTLINQLNESFILVLNYDSNNRRNDNCNP